MITLINFWVVNQLTELIKFGHGPGLYVADIGIPGDLYKHFGIRQPDFGQSGIVKYTNMQG